MKILEASGIINRSRSRSSLKILMLAAVLMIAPPKTPRAQTDRSSFADSKTSSQGSAGDRSDSITNGAGPPAPAITVAIPATMTEGPAPTGSAAYTGWRPSYLRGQSTFTAELFTGLRYDTDANQAAETSITGQIGQTITPSTLQEEAAWSFLTKLSLGHAYYFPHWANTVWETGVEASDQRFSHISHNYDLTTLQFTTGPRIPVGNIGAFSTSVRPFGSLAWIGYAESTFSSLYGGGLSVDFRTPRSSTSLTGVGRFGNYQDSTFRPLSRPYSGPEWLLSISSTILVATTTTLTASLSWYQASGRSDNFSRNGPAGSISVERNLLLMTRPTDLVIRGSVQRLLYGGPAPQTQSTVARDDTQWIADVVFTVPIFQVPAATGFQSTKAVVEYQYLNNRSNYFPFTDHSLTVGVKISL
jgi:hypothetical protein